MMQIDYPFHINGKRRTELASEDKHIRDLIEQLLFTAPGERVNRPSFGTGLMQLVFAPNSPDLANATQFLVQGALQQWLGDRIQIEAVRIDSQDCSLNITVQYLVKRSQQRQMAQLSRSL